jgi:hypothetical protein
VITALDDAGEYKKADEGEGEAGGERADYAYHLPE